MTDTKCKKKKKILRHIHYKKTAAYRGKKSSVCRRNKHTDETSPRK